MILAVGAQRVATQRLVPSPVALAAKVKHEAVLALECLASYWLLTTLIALLWLCLRKPWFHKDLNIVPVFYAVVLEARVIFHSIGEVTVLAEHQVRAPGTKEARSNYRI